MCVSFILSCILLKQPKLNLNAFTSATFFSPGCPPVAIIKGGGVEGTISQYISDSFVFSALTLSSVTMKQTPSMLYVHAKLTVVDL